MPEKQRCGAKTRKGDPCRAWAMENGRCRMHGGSTEGGGGQPGNKNALTHGEHESIFADQLEDDELSFFRTLNTGVEAQLEEQIKLSAIRMARMMARVKRLKAAAGFTVTRRQTKEKEGTGKGPEEGAFQESETTTREEATLGQIQSIEDAITRVEKEHRKLIDLKHRIEEAKPGEDNIDISGFMGAIRDAAKKLDWEEPEGDA